MYQSISNRGLFHTKNIFVNHRNQRRKSDGHSSNELLTYEHDNIGNLTNINLNQTSDQHLSLSALSGATVSGHHPTQNYKAKYKQQKHYYSKGNSYSNLTQNSSNNNSQNQLQLFRSLERSLDNLDTERKYGTKHTSSFKGPGGHHRQKYCTRTRNHSNSSEINSVSVSQSFPSFEIEDSLDTSAILPKSLENNHFSSSSKHLILRRSSRKSHRLAPLEAPCSFRNRTQSQDILVNKKKETVVAKNVSVRRKLGSSEAYRNSKNWARLDYCRSQIHQQHKQLKVESTADQEKQVPLEQKSSQESKSSNISSKLSLFRKNIRIFTGPSIRPIKRLSIKTSKSKVKQTSLIYFKEPSGGTPLSTMPRTNLDGNRIRDDRPRSGLNIDQDRDAAVDGTFAKTILSKLNQIRKHENSAYKSCDIALRVEDRTICLHELIASMHCDEESILFRSRAPIIEGTKLKLISIPDGTFVGASLMLDYFYTGKTKLNFTNALLVMRIASMVKANSLVRICCDFINKSVLSEKSDKSRRDREREYDRPKTRREKSRPDSAIDRPYQSSSRNMQGLQVGLGNKTVTAQISDDNQRNRSEDDRYASQFSQQVASVSRHNLAMGMGQIQHTQLPPIMKNASQVYKSQDNISGTSPLAMVSDNHGNNLDESIGYKEFTTEQAPVLTDPNVLHKLLNQNGKVTKQIIDTVLIKNKRDNPESFPNNSERIKEPPVKPARKSKEERPRPEWDNSNLSASIEIARTKKVGQKYSEDRDEEETSLITMVVQNRVF